MPHFTVPGNSWKNWFSWCRSERHMDISGCLSNCADVEIRQTGAGLNSLRQDRNQSDYDLHRVLSHPNAARSVKAAERVILVLTTLGVPTREAITEAMKTYECDILKETSWRCVELTEHKPEWQLLDKC